MLSQRKHINEPKCVPLAALPPILHTQEIHTPCTPPGKGCAKIRKTGFNAALQAFSFTEKEPKLYTTDPLEPFKIAIYAKNPPITW
jgi:hypothetical protein